MKLNDLITQTTDQLGYQNYKKILPQILAMMEESWQGEALPSSYWQEELEGFDYMFDASPLIVAKLREHCYHLTGLRSYEYRGHHAHKSQAFANKLAALRKLDSRGLFVPESAVLGGYGHEIDGQLVNLDTLKFYESLIAMDHGGVLEPLRIGSGHKVVVEIGAGWGGFGYQLKSLCKGLTYVIIDLPPTLLFSSVYLSTAFPDAKVFVYGDGNLEDAMKSIHEYDFVFLPHFLIPQLRIPKIDLAVNMISFQEMTTDQVESYVDWLSKNGCPQIYSHNRGRSPHNTQLSDVTDLLKHRYNLSEVMLLPVPYTVLNMPNSGSEAEKVVLPKDNKAIARFLLANALRPAKKKLIGPSLADYRHMIGQSFDDGQRVSLDNGRPGGLR